MTKTKFVTKDNVHEATDLDGIRNLMANAQRLGATEVVEKCSDRLASLGKHLKVYKKSKSQQTQLKIPRIDYEYWASNHSFYSETPFEKGNTVKIGLGHAEKGGLIKAKDYNNAESLLSAIKNKVLQSNLDDISVEEILIIFDLIQGWGGKMCKQPYVAVKKRMPLRISKPEEFARNYLKVIRGLTEVASSEKFEFASIESLVRSLDKLDRVTLNFGSKHFFFWSMFRNQKKILYIYDTRMKAILKTLAGRQVSYFSYLEFLERIEDIEQLEQGIAERGLFAFSNNFFSNSNPPKLKSISKIENKHQIEIAKSFIDG